MIMMLSLEVHYRAILSSFHSSVIIITIFYGVSDFRIKMIEEGCHLYIKQPHLL